MTNRGPLSQKNSSVRQSDSSKQCDRMHNRCAIISLALQPGRRDYNLTAARKSCRCIASMSISSCTTCSCHTLHFSHSIAALHIVSFPASLPCFNPCSPFQRSTATRRDAKRRKFARFLLNLRRCNHVAVTTRREHAQQPNIPLHGAIYCKE